uniref:Proteophosphoglycan ppg4 n=1 Tax=Mycena chlorophos TaxID=658473 RepID=A0ABQ0L1I0_MYCCL|nr:predicted protein [Mycena chlorophos]
MQPSGVMPAAPNSSFGVFSSTSGHVEGAPPMHARPPNLDGPTAAFNLQKAQGAELRLWIEQTNTLASARVLFKTGRNEVLRARLGTYYNLDYEHAAAPVATGPAPLSTSIIKRQWDYLANTLGGEWADKEARGEPFQLLERQGESSAQESILARISSFTDTLPTNSTLHPSDAALSAHAGDNPAAFRALIDAAAEGDSETVQAMLTSAQDGDASSLSALFQLRASLTNSPSGSQVPSVVLPAAPPPFPAVPLRASKSTEGPSATSAILSVSAKSFSALETAKDLRHVIQLCRSGRVEEVRKDNKETKTYGRAKGRLDRHDRIYAVLTEDFKNDEARFLAFFTKPQQPGTSKSRKRRADEVADEPKYIAIRLVAQAIPHCKTDILAERALAKYQVNGQFSEEVWEAAWPDMNYWDIWRALGKESYY